MSLCPCCVVLVLVSISIFVDIFLVNICVDFCTLIMQDSQGDQPPADETFPVEN